MLKLNWSIFMYSRSILRLSYLNDNYGVAVKVQAMSLSYVNALHRQLDKGIKNLLIIWKPQVNFCDTHERVNPGQSWVCFILHFCFTLEFQPMIPKSKKSHYKQRCIAGSNKGSTRSLSKLFVSISGQNRASELLLHYSRSVVNQMRSLQIPKIW